MMEQNVCILWPCTHQCTFHLTCYDLISIIHKPQLIYQGSTFVTLLLNPCISFFPYMTIANLRWSQPHMIMKMHSPSIKTCKIPYNWCFLTLENEMTTFCWLATSWALLAIDWSTTMICPSVTFICSLIAYCPMFTIASYLLCIGWGKGCFLTLGSTLDEEPLSRIQWNRAILFYESHKLDTWLLDEGPWPKTGKIKTKHTWCTILEEKSIGSDLWKEKLNRRAHDLKSQDAS